MTERRSARLRAVVLAAGMGTRLRPTTDTLPKPLIPLRGRPLVEHTLLALRDAGVTEAVIVAGYRAEELSASLSVIPGLDQDVVINDRFHLGASHSLAAARGTCGADPFLLVMSDHLLSAGLLRRLASPGPVDACRVAADRSSWPADYVEEATLLRTGTDGRVYAIGKQIAPFDALDAGAFACTSEIWDAVDAAPEDCDLSTIFSVLVQRGRLYAEDVTGCPWYDVDTPEDARRAERVIFGDQRREPAVSAS